MLDLAIHRYHYFPFEKSNVSLSDSIRPNFSQRIPSNNVDKIIIHKKIRKLSDFLQSKESSPNFGFNIKAINFPLILVE